MKNTFVKSLAIILNVALVGTSFADIGMPASVAAGSGMPGFVRTLTPPTQLGYVTEAYQGSTDKPVILIQDLHGNYGVQKNILHILEHFQPLVTQGGHPAVVGTEGAWGPFDMSYFRKYSQKVREVAGDFLMKEAEMSGMEQFASISQQPVQLVGIENPQDYLLNLDVFRKSFVVRLQLAHKVENLRAAVVKSKVDAPLALQRIWRAEDAFHSGKIDLNELARRLNLPSLSNYGQAEAALMKRKEEVAAKSGTYAVNIVRADGDLQLLSRLLRQQLTLEEVQFASQRVPAMLTTIQTLLPGQDMSVWQDAIRSAMDYYAVALMRDKPLSQRAVELAQKNPGTSVMIVTGGFHTAGIAEQLKAKHFSYLVVAPNVDSHTDFDETLYLKRMMGVHVTKQEIQNKQLAREVKASAHANMQLTGPATIGKATPGITPTDAKNLTDATEQAFEEASGENGDQNHKTASLKDRELSKADQKTLTKILAFDGTAVPQSKIADITASWPDRDLAKQFNETAFFEHPELAALDSVLIFTAAQAGHNAKQRGIHTSAYGLTRLAGLSKSTDPKDVLEAQKLAAHELAHLKDLNKTERQIWDAGYPLDTAQAAVQRFDVRYQANPETAHVVEDLGRSVEIGQLPGVPTSLLRRFGRWITKPFRGATKIQSETTNLPVVEALPAIEDTAAAAPAQAAVEHEIARDAVSAAAPLPPEITTAQLERNLQTANLKPSTGVVAMGRNILNKVTWGRVASADQKARMNAAEEAINRRGQAESTENA